MHCLVKDEGIHFEKSYIKKIEDITVLNIKFDITLNLT